MVELLRFIEEFCKNSVSEGSETDAESSEGDEDGDNEKEKKRKKRSSKDVSGLNVPLTMEHLSQVEVSIPVVSLNQKSSIQLQAIFERLKKTLAVYS